MAKHYYIALEAHLQQTTTHFLRERGRAWKIFYDVVRLQVKRV